MKSFVLCLAVVLSPLLALSQSYDLVIQGGRVIDPETGLDAVRNVGISQGKIKKISAAALEGKRVIPAKGLIVAPGFIDLHQHDLDQESPRLSAVGWLVCLFKGFRDIFWKFILGPITLEFRQVANHRRSAALDHGLLFFVDFADHLIQPFAGALPAKEVQQAKNDESDSF
jgi:cytosine/adenosine deaminase-related metal-dependent hydrolase